MDPNQKLFPDSIDTIVKEYLGGKTIGELAEQWGVHKSSIRRVLRDRKIKPRIGRPKRPPPPERKCHKCGEVKPLEEFANHKGFPGGKDYRCKLCANRMRNDRRLRKVFGISQDQYDELFKKQEGKCAICGREEQTIDPRNKLPRRLSVDHIDTDQGPKIRGLLCQKCNVSLGNFHDDISLLLKAIDYLKTNGG